MQKEVENLLKSLDMSTEEINKCLSICQGLEYVDVGRINDNIYVMINHGYPKDDLGLFICINPSVLLYNPNELDKKLSLLGADTEEILKTSPFAI